MLLQFVDAISKLANTHHSSIHCDDWNNNVGFVDLFS